MNIELSFEWLLIDNFFIGFIFTLFILSEEVLTFEPKELFFIEDGFELTELNEDGLI